MEVVVIGGCGHVGLPLGVVLAQRGCSVTAYDTNVSAVKNVNDGKPPFRETNLDENLNSALLMGTFRATSDPGCIKRADVVVIVIGTPIDEHRNPDPNKVPDVIEELRDYFSKDQLIIMRSTVFPGVTKRVEEKFLSIDNSINVVFCPERLAEGHAIEELQELPQLIGARDSNSFLRAKEVFSKLGVDSIMLSPEEAELGKLFTNVWRYIRFSIANQFYMLSTLSGLDYEKIRQSLIHQYPRAADMPKAGFTAGPCLLKDTLALVSFSGNEFPLGQAAVSVNEGLPLFLVNKIKSQYDISIMTVGILGMTFKANVDDIRSSLAFKLRKTLLFHSKKVMWHDPYWEDSGSSSLNSILKESDIIIIATPHKEYEILETPKPIIDIWSFTNKNE